MTLKIKQYKPIKFGDGPDPDTVEGHRNKMAEAAERRAYNQRMKELEAEDKYRRESLLEKILDSSSRGDGSTERALLHPSPTSSHPTPSSERRRLVWNKPRKRTSRPPPNPIPAKRIATHLPAVKLPPVQRTSMIFVPKMTIRRSQLPKKLPAS
jgi:hypothetical protein